ncbi:tryptophan aminotransferase-related protein 4-like [Mangifera indica]|uniref:tryptophan aminotransferase-related protein 4-like n=1 Tax=Mangifera indica TaxID=29780 RepID=UPI001CFA24E2|nr:tryptophan aminotransferase-related protein 4-like [Mangifera indica]
MAKIQSSKYVFCLVSSLILNLISIRNLYVGSNWNLSWSSRAAREAETVAAISCSGHGRAYLDGIVVDGEQPVCECNSCYSGPDCSQLLPDCAANANGGDPLFLEPFWMQNAASSAILVAGWHRMSYSYADLSVISQELERHIRKLHAVVGNAVTENRFIIFGAGSTQLLNAAVHALSPDNSSSPAKVVATIPFYPVYQRQTDFFQSVDFQFYGDTSLWKNTSDTGKNLIEFVTAPNNPDGKMNKAVLQGPNVKQIYDHAYYWPHFTPISAPADGDVMIFTLSKMTGHAGSRLGWALIKEENVYERMTTYMSFNTMGVSRDSQLRALKLVQVVLENRGKEIFEFGYKTMRSRWEKLSKIISLSKRFSLQEIASQNCNFFHKVRPASPAYAWLRCEMEEDKDCYEVLRGGNIEGREGSKFSAEDRHVRLSLIRGQDDFDMLLLRLNKLISEEDGDNYKTM